MIVGRRHSACLPVELALSGTHGPADFHPYGVMTAPPPKGRAASVIVWSAAVLGALAVLAAAALWFYYGTAVFFEMIAAGIAACF